MERYIVVDQDGEVSVYRHRIDEAARALFKADLLRLCTGICVDTAKYMRDKINKEDLDERMLEAVNDFFGRWT